MQNRKKSIRRGYPTKMPYFKKPLLIAYQGFKIIDGVLKVPLGDRQYFDIPLNNHTKLTLSDPALKVRSFTLTAGTISLTISKEVGEMQCTKTLGVDRNLANVAAGNSERVVMCSLKKAVEVADNYRSVMRALKRNDARIRRKVASKNGPRRRNREQP